MEYKYLTIDAINKYLEYKFKIDENLKDILVKAEISTLSISNGNYYITIKDDKSKMEAKMFKYRANSLTFTPKVGDEVILEGSITLYVPHGRYSLIIDKMMPAGEGAYKLYLEKLKKELGAKGYFNLDRKREIPKYPKCIAVITSPTGAVVKDVKETIRRRYSNLTLLLYPTLVQGPFAGKNIAAQIIKANNDNLADVIIIGRGGGAVEELACFNDRAVCDAVFYSKIPVISAVGHERDDTLSDLIADLRVSTPTAAGEKVTEEYIKVVDKLNYDINKLNNLIDNKIYDYKSTLEGNFKVLKLCNPKVTVNNYKAELDKLSYDLNNNISDIINYNKDLLFNNLEIINKEILNIVLYNKNNLDYKTMMLEKNSPVNDFKNHNLDISNKISNLNNLIKNKIENSNHNYNYLIGKLSSINPAKLLDKGYSMTSCNDKIISSVNEVKNDDLITVSLKDGKLKAIIKEIING